MGPGDDGKLTPKAPSAADPSETFERVIPRRKLKIEPGDVVLTRTRIGINQEAFELRVTGNGDLPDRFATFERAAARGELLANERHTRLLFVERDDQSPLLLADARRS